MAAAFVGFVMLGRRLYNMKKKTRSLQLKVLLDDKVTSLVYLIVYCSLSMLIHESCGYCMIFWCDMSSA
jgi:hypothetical protein